MRQIIPPIFHQQANLNVTLMHSVCLCVEYVGKSLEEDGIFHSMSLLHLSHCFKVQSLGSRSLRLFINDNNNCKQSNSINNILVNNESKS